MRLRFLYTCVVVAILTSCSSKKTETTEAADTTENTSESAPAQSTVEYVDELGDIVRGFDSIEALSASLVESLVNEDYKGYLSHTMTREMEMNQARMIQDSTVKKMFVAEYGFSLREEKHYFDFTIKYLKEHDVDISKAILDEVEFIPYKKGRYEPLELFEVFIPVENEYPMTIDVVVIKIEDKYYLTSEMGI